MRGERKQICFLSDEISVEGKKKKINLLRNRVLVAVMSESEIDIVQQPHNKEQQLLGLIRLVSKS